MTVSFADPRLWDFVLESNRIEGIVRDPTLGEVAAHDNLLKLETVTVETISEFVATVARADLRDKPGMDVRVGKYFPPLGGRAIRTDLHELLTEINDEELSPWEAHVAYETLHPYMDGNGRSGRVIWAWQMLRQDSDPFRLGFLHAAYYQALNHGRTP